MLYIKQWIGSPAMFEDADRSLSRINSEPMGMVFCMTLEVIRETIESCGIYDIRPVAIHRHSKEYYEADIEFLPENLDDLLLIHVVVTKCGFIDLTYPKRVTLHICRSVKPDFEKIRIWTEDVCKELKRSGRLWQWSYDASC